MTEARSLTAWLQALALEQVTITAVIDPTGRLLPIGSLWEKLQAAIHEATALGVHVVVVAADQPGVPEQLLAPDAAPLRILQAATLQDAVEKLYEEHGPRAAVRRHER